MAVVPYMFMPFDSPNAAKAMANYGRDPGVNVSMANSIAIPDGWGDYYVTCAQGVKTGVRTGIIPGTDGTDWHYLEFEVASNTFNDPGEAWNPYEFLQCVDEDGNQLWELRMFHQSGSGYNYNRLHLLNTDGTPAGILAHDPIGTINTFYRIQLIWQQGNSTSFYCMANGAFKSVLFVDTQAHASTQRKFQYVFSTYAATGVGANMHYAGAVGGTCDGANDFDSHNYAIRRINWLNHLLNNDWKNVAGNAWSHSGSFANVNDGADSTANFLKLSSTFAVAYSGFYAAARYPNRGPYNDFMLSNPAALLGMKIAAHFRCEKGVTGSPTFTIRVGNANNATSSGATVSVGTFGDMRNPETAFGWIAAPDSNWPDIDADEWLAFGWELDQGAFGRFVEMYELDGWVLYDQNTYQDGMMHARGKMDLRGRQVLQGNGV